MVFILCWIACSNNSRPLHAIQGETMGTNFVVKIISRGAELNQEDLDSEINGLLREVNRQMSTYIEDSEISLFNRSTSTDWFEISADFAEVLQKAQDISRKTQGAFDITVGPLVNLWGFGPENRRRVVPDEDELARRRAWTSFEKIHVRLSPPAVRKEQPEVQCDLSAIAKGFGVDKVGEWLEARGFADYMVEIGGEVRTRGRNQDGVAWRIGIESPDTSPGIRKALAISGYSMATSGDYVNYFEKDGVRYSHTIDPRTGRPITHKLASVTVIHESCTMADGLATAISVLGPDAGFEFAVREELPVYLIVRDASGFVEKMTPGFERFIH